MKTVQKDANVERRVLTAMIVSPAVLGAIAARWERSGLFASEWSNIIGGWCIRYFETYNKAPGKAIEGLFESWAQDHRSKESVSLIERYLSTLSGEYQALKADINPDFVIDLAAKLFTRVRLEALADSIKSRLDLGDVDKAQAKVDSYNRLELGTGGLIDVFHDLNAVKQSFAARQGPIVTYPGALGKFMKDTMERDALVAFMGADKRGKSFWLQDLATRAIFQGRRVLMLEVGDQSQDQLMGRILSRIAGRPRRAGTIRYPKFISRENEDAMATVDFEEREYDKPLTWEQAWKAAQKKLGKMDMQKRLKLACYPAGTVSVLQVIGIIRNLIRSGWEPDVLVLDYADLLAPPTGYTESRDQVNATWKGLRRISQEFHLLVATATQSDTDGYSAKILSRKNFSEDKRKMAHVTGMIGINATPEEEENGLRRLNYIVLRDSEFTTQECVHVAGCLAIANPAVCSTF